MRVLEKYDEIMNIILPTLREKEEKPIVHFYRSVLKVERYWKSLLNLQIKKMEI